MKTKLLNFKALAVIMACLTCALSASAYDMEVNGIYYTKLTNNTVEVAYANINSADYSGNITIPAQVRVGTQSWTVKGIGYKAFGECTNLTSVTLPTSLTYVGELAFIRCSSLSSINIPEGVTWIGSNAFEQCSSMTLVHLPSTLESIGNIVFNNCGSLGYIICEAYEPPTLGTNAFSSSVYSNAYLVLNNAVIKERYKAAEGWSNFSHIDAISYYSFEDNGIYYAETSPTTVAVCAKDDNYNSYSATVNVPSTAVNISRAYYVTEVGPNAFRNCDRLFHVYLPFTLKKISDFAFANCYNLSESPIPDDSQLTEIGNNAFTNVYFSSFKFPESLTKIGNYAFSGCNELTRIDIPDNVTTIGGSAFWNCTGLKYVTIGYGCESIGDGAFQACSSLLSVTSRAITPPSIGFYTFRISFNEFTTASLTVPYSSLSAYQSAYQWSLFSNVYQMAYDFEKYGIYYRITGDNTVGVSYKSTSYNSYSGWITVPSQVTFNGTTYDVNTICNSAFRSCTDLTMIGLPNSITTIEANAFNGCTGLTQIEIPTSVTYIGTSAFSNCTGLTKVTTQNPTKWCGITFANAQANPLYYGHNLYFGSALMSSLTLTATINQIKSYTFYGCTSLTKITLGDDVTSIGGYAFNGCTGLTTVEIGSGMTSIGAAAFKGCTSLTSFTCMATTPPTIQSSTFDTSHYTSTTLFVANYQVRNAYAAANYWKNFLNINSLTDYDFEQDGIYYKIYYDNELGVVRSNNEGNTYSGDVVIPETVVYNGETYTVVEIDAYAFTNCPNLTSVTIPATVRIVTNAFFNNQATGLTSITCLAITPPTGMTQMTADQYANVTVTVPKNSVAAYQANGGWGQFSTINGMTYDFALDGLFYEIRGTGEVMVTREDGSSYSNCYEVHIPATASLAGVSYDVTAIKNQAFYQRTGLVTVYLPSSVRSIGDFAFYGCSILATINFNDVDTIGSYSFAYCTSLANVKLNGYLKSIQGTSFAFCTSLQNYQRYAVENVPGLTYEFVNGVIFTKNAADKTLVSYPCGKNAITYTVPDGTVYIGDHAFCGNTIVKTVNMPTSLREIRQYAFYSCTKITSIEVPKGVTIIGNFAFCGCTALQNVLLPSTLTSLGGAAFHDDAALTIIKTKAKTPPTCRTATIRPNTYTPFDQTHFTSAMLRVPTGYKTAYQAANVWKLFSTIREDDSLLENDIILGDVNGDGVVDVSDVTALIGYVLGNGSGDFVVEAADINGDDSVDVADVTALISIVLGN